MPVARGRSYYPREIEVRWFHPWKEVSLDSSLARALKLSVVLLGATAGVPSGGKKWEKNRRWDCRSPNFSTDVIVCKGDNYSGQSSVSVPDQVLLYDCEGAKVVVLVEGRWFFAAGANDARSTRVTMLCSVRWRSSRF